MKLASRSFLSTLLLAVTSTLGAQTDIAYVDQPGGLIPINEFTLCGDPPTTGTEIIRFFDVKEGGNVRDVNLGFRALHEWRSEIKLVLRHPDGTLVTLCPAIGNDGADNYDVLFDDASTNPLSDGTSDNVNAPFFDRTVRSDEPLSAFNGKPAAGIWLLFICDRSPASFVGNYLSSELRIQLSTQEADLGLSHFTFADPFGRQGRSTPTKFVIQNVGSDDLSLGTAAINTPVGGAFDVTNLSATSGNATFNSSTGKIDWTGTLGSGGSAEISFGVRPSSPTGQLSISATLGGGTAPTVTPSAALTVKDPINGGIDGSNGYRVRDNYHTGGPTFAWRDASNGTSLGLGENDTVSVTAPFPISFYGANSTSLRVGNNGGIYFNNTTSAVSFFNNPIANEARPFIGPFYDDIGGDTGGVWSKTFGTAPNREFVIQWTRPHFRQTTLPDSLSEGTFEVVFFEGRTAILFQYLDAFFQDPIYDWGRDATIGVTNGNAGQSLQYGYNQEVLLDGLAIEFTADAPRSEEVWNLF